MIIIFFFLIIINFPADRCFNYSTISDADRKSTFDTSEFSEGVCDHLLLEGWYRFEGAAGTKMPTAEVDGYHCNTAYPGWLNGAEPTVGDGEVSRRICFTRSTNVCKYTNEIKVKNCGSYFIYKLVPVPGCNSRYCGTDWTSSSQKKIHWAWFVVFNSSKILVIYSDPIYHYLSQGRPQLIL